MRKRFYLFKRGGMYYLQDGTTGQQHSLHTRSRSVAERLWHARNEADSNPRLNLALARVYLSGNDPKMLTRTWQDVFDEFCSRGQPVGGKKSVAIEKATFRASTMVRYLRQVARPVLCSVYGTVIDEDLDGRWARFFSPCRTLGQLLALPQAACRRY